MAQLDPIAVKFLGLEIHWYAIMIVLGVLLGAIVAHKEAVKHGLGEEVVVDFILIALPCAILGARLYYVLFQGSYYFAHPDQIIAIWNGGLAIYGGLIAGFLVFYFFTKKEKLNRWKFLDILLPSILLGQAIGRWGNFFNHEAYGGEVSKDFLTQTLHLPNFIVENMYINGSYHAPTFLYESLWCFLGFILLICLRRRANFLKIGQIAMLELAWYAFERFFVEGMRTDSLMIGSLRVSQMLSLILFVTGVTLFVLRGRMKENPYYLEK